jgi:glycosyltransferase involved in cell wall biosynthesis
MTGEPEVTVVMIFLNAGEFIREAIESVFGQSYTDWELLFVDDGSTDESTAIALEYAKKYPEKVRYLQHPNRANRGISASQNLGISNARGAYIAFLDADDVWLPGKLREQVELMNAQPQAAMVYGYTYYWYSWAGNAAGTNRDLLIDPGLPLDALVSPPLLLAKFLRGDAPIPCPTDVLIRREVIEAVGGFEESFRRIFTDQVFYAKLCLKYPVYVSGQCWFKYRKHPNSSVAVVKKSGQWRSARLNYLGWLEGYLREQKVEDKEIWDALKVARWKCRHPELASLQSRLASAPDHARYNGRVLRERLRSVARFILPIKMHRWLRARWHTVTHLHQRVERD